MQWLHVSFEAAPGTSVVQNHAARLHYTLTEGQLSGLMPFMYAVSEKPLSAGGHMSR